jgi:uncharacterized protein with NRDE domain
MCTVIISLEPSSNVPLLLIGIRDELAARPWQPPARHWPGSPLIGGRDQQAGGTWLAVHPGVPRVSCVLNGRGLQAPQAQRRSRGELPLLAADEGDQALARLREDPAGLAAFDPFHLVSADVAAVTLLSWDGSQAAYRDLAPGTHIITNSGFNPNDPKAVHFAARFAAQRPPAEAAMGIAEAWEPWLTLIGGDGLSLTDPRAIRVSRQLSDGQLWGTTSISLVALSTAGIRYDFQPVPGSPASVDI